MCWVCIVSITITLTLTQVYLRDCTPVSPYPVLLFGGRLSVYHRQVRVRVRFRFRVGLGLTCCLELGEVLFAVTKLE